MLSDLRDSGEIENHADVVSFMFREELYKPDREDLRGRAELIIAKQRNGPTGTCALSFDGPTMRRTSVGSVGPRLLTVAGAAVYIGRTRSAVDGPFMRFSDQKEGAAT